jgi:hypothetical protein
MEKASQNKCAKLSRPVNEAAASTPRKAALPGSGYCVQSIGF